MRVAAGLAALPMVWLAGTSAAVELSAVRHRPESFDPAAGESATVEYALSGRATVELRVYDGRDWLIRTVEAGERDAGIHSVAWDGRDWKGRPVPPEAYRYTLEARDGAGQSDTWDPSDTTGGQVGILSAIRRGEKGGSVDYSLTAPSRVRVRIGLRNGPLLRTLIDWVPRARGEHSEDWDGRDAAGVLTLGDHPNLIFDAKAFSLPANTFLVGAAPSEVVLISDVPPDAPKRTQTAKRRRRVYDYPYQDIGSRRDFPLLLELPAAQVYGDDGLPVVKGPLAVKLDVPDAQLASVLNERCEAVFYVDGHYVFETEMGFLPMTWTFDPDGTAAGVHYISANLRGYEGHFGMHTLKVRVEPTSAGGGE